MSSEFELRDLSKKGQVGSPPINAASDPSRPPTYPEETDPKESATTSWTWATSIILLTWSSVLIFLPHLLLFAVGQSQHLTPLESFLALHFGLLLAFSAVGLIINIPSSSTGPGSTPALDNGSAAHPLIVPFTSFSLLSAFLSYNTTGAGNLPKFYSTFTGLVGIWGLWVITFAGPKLVSRKTGADKHTSAFIFGNKSSASEQKKFWKREQKGKGH
ncbi:hypothetical protein EDB85DRAFT_915312 [Lactarius pseudohatsudake]|nr:hypothetical protein EDB85DRAFT_915312 [Lactarius pseudohatsudake]